VAVFRKFEHPDFKKGDQPGIDTDADDERKQFTESICFVKPKNKSKPVFRIVIDHGLGFFT
jgi:hypothetical protein